MTYEQYWYGEPQLIRAYMKAEELRSKRENANDWRRGLYVYEALVDVSPLLHAFAQKGTKPLPYPKKPYGFDNEKTEEEVRAEAENTRLKAIAYFKLWGNAVGENFDG